MSSEANKAIIRRFFEEVYNRGHYAVADELVAEGYVSHNELAVAVLGPEGIKRAAAAQREAFPDLVTTLVDVIAEGDKVVVRGRDDGTHVGEFLGFAPTGRRFTFTWIDIFRLENGKLAEAWLETNVESLKRQLSPEPIGRESATP